MPPVAHPLTVMCSRSFSLSCQVETENYHPGDDLYGEAGHKGICGDSGEPSSQGHK